MKAATMMSHNKMAAGRKQTLTYDPYAKQPKEGKSKKVNNLYFHRPMNPWTKQSINQSNQSINQSINQSLYATIINAHLVNQSISQKFY